MLQAALPWAQCVAEMWSKDRPSSANATTSTALDTTTVASVATAPASKETSVSESGNKTAISSIAPPALPDQTGSSNNLISNNGPLGSSSGSLGSAINTSPMEMTRVVKILKQNEPLGIMTLVNRTICNLKKCTCHKNSWIL